MADSFIYLFLVGVAFFFLSFAAVQSLELVGSCLMVRTG